MKNSQTGFIVPLLIIVIAALVVGGGFYISTQNEALKNMEETAKSEPVTTSISPMRKDSNSAPIDNTKPVNTVVPTSVVKTKVNVTNPAIIPQLSVKGNVLTVIEGGKVIQTLTADEFALNVDSASRIPGFITNKDINFDGYNDMAVLSSTGYAGVNYYYDFYVYDPKTKMFEQILEEVPNPKIDTIQKQIRTSQKSGPQWYEDVLSWNGSAYVTLPERR